MSDAIPFDGRSSAMRGPSPWLASENLDGLGDVEVTIESVIQHTNATMQDGRKTPKLFALKFTGKDMQLVLNATNRKSLVKLYGVDTKEWRGKKIKLYVQDGVRCPSGGTTKGIRIR